ncbi:MAG: hypothetical protein ACOCX4_08100 [Planctomycetota bacterium]
MKRCHQCGTPWTERHSPGHRAECPKCLAPLHACRNCRFFVEDARQWCNEPMARDEKPRDPAAACTCSYFVFRDTPEGDDAPAGDGGKTEDWMRFDRTTKADLDQIFKPPDPTD